MRVLLVSGSFPPMACGVGDYARALATALSGREDVQVGVLTSAAADPAAARGFEVFPLMRAWSDAEAGVVTRLLRTWKPDLVHIQFPTRGYVGKLPWHLPALLRARGVPVVQTWHEYFPQMGSLLDAARSTWRDLPLALFGRDVIVVRPDYVRRMPWWVRALTARKRFHLVPNAPTVPRVVLEEAERSAVRGRWTEHRKALLVFFGFCFEHKGIDDVLAAMDPDLHQLVIVGDLDETDPYQASLAGRIGKPPLAGHVTPAGFLPPEEAARVLAAADAVVLPFRSGGGSWNSSIKAAALQGTFVLTTSTERHGLDPDGNIYYARPRDPADLADALRRYLGRRGAPSAVAAIPTWTEICEQHLAIYSRNV